ncbi:MAG: dienelactone hydrolase family protein [Saprospiraceae bacterium]|nr:dienelactone hydrolase family protein [Saprospiraceae bacterium]
MTKTTNHTIQISEKIGSVSALWTSSSNSEYLLVLGHGAGAGMTHTFMEGLANALAKEGIATLRYNFPYMEQKKKRPDYPAVAHKTIEEVVNFAANSSKLPLFVGGKSFGGRMSSQWISKEPKQFVRGLIFYGFPLHSPAKPGAERAEHLFAIKIPMLFLQGDRDNLAKLDLLKPVLAKLPLSTLEVFQGGNHSFRFPKKSGITESEALIGLAKASLEFCRAVTTK